MVRALTRMGSDHTPLLIDSGEASHIGNKSLFSFELAWLRPEGFYEMVVRAEWMSVSVGLTPIEKWQNKIRHVHKFLRGWAKNKRGEYKILRDKLWASALWLGSEKLGIGRWFCPIRSLGWRFFEG